MILHKTLPLGLSGLPPAQLQTLHIAGHIGNGEAGGVSDVTRLLHTQGVFDELTSLRFSDGSMHVGAKDLTSQEVPRCEFVHRCKFSPSRAQPKSSAWNHLFMSTFKLSKPRI